MNRRLFLQTSLLATGGIVASRIDVEAQSPRPRSLRDVFSRQDPKVNALLARMTLEEKVGQMLQAEQSGLKDLSDIEKSFIGSILSGGSSDPKSGNSLDDWTNLYDSLQTRTRNTRLRIPILYGIDAVHGHNNVLNAVVFPHNIGMDCTRNPSLVERAARVTAVEVRATGINWTFAPCVTVPRDERWGRTYEGFSETPELAGDLGEAAVRGFQGADLSNPTSVLACAKHFISDGGTSFGTSLKTKMLDRGDSRLTEREIIGETPFAEMLGDRASLELSSEDVAVVEKIKRTGIPVVTVIISGRPMILGKSLELSDALIAAWLPGTEGLGVTDVLFGDYRPTGRLSFSWPRTMEQIPINVGDVNYDPLFKYGYGLTYRRK